MELSGYAYAQGWAQQTVLAALVITHSDPAHFADVLERLFGTGQVEWAKHGMADPAAQKIARSVFEEIRDVARSEAARRAASST